MEYIFYMIEENLIVVVPEDSTAYILMSLQDGFYINIGEL